jgi:integrase
MGKTAKKTVRLNFTLRALEAKPTPEKKRSLYRDTQVPELGLMIQPTGHRSFFWYRKVNGQPTWKTLGKFEDLSLEQARDAARQLSNDRAVWKNNKYKGDNPFKTRREELTFSEMVEEYIKRRVPSLKNPSETEKRLRQGVKRDFPASWKNRKLSEISKKDIVELRDKIGADRPALANAAVRAIKYLFFYVMDPEVGLWNGENPASRIKLFPRKSRDRFAQPDEMPRLFDAMLTEPNPDLIDYIKLALWTGARKKDIFSMRWQDVSLPDNRWSVPDPKSDPYTVALVPEAIEVLTSRLERRIKDNPWVFPSHGKTGHVTDLKARWKELLKRAKITNLTMHDLRRTLGSWQAAQGASLQIIAKSLGHKSMGATQIYARLNLDPVRASVTAATQAIITASKKKPEQLEEQNG